MRNYVAEFEAKAKKLQDEIDAIESKGDTNNVYIVNVGSMNHGKSSLFNSLLNRNAFKAQDKRETKEPSDALWFDSVYLTDTPGLHADDVDDQKAREAYRKANMLVFVHTIKNGELHLPEIEALNALKALFNEYGEKFFWEHFCLVLTFLEEVIDEDDRIIIIDKILGDISRKCGGKDFPLFVVSNSIYADGIEEQDSELIEFSGINQLRDFLTSNIQKWRGENQYVRQQQLNRVKAEFQEERNRMIDELRTQQARVRQQYQSERNQIERQIEDKKKAVERRQRDFLRRAENAVNAYYADDRTHDSKLARLRQLRSELEECTQSHREARSWFDN